MKVHWLIMVLLGATLTGCGETSSTARSSASPAARVKVAYDQGSIKKGDKGHCVVCAVKEGNSQEEPVAEVIDYKGKTYAFCNEKEKAEFISDPSKYVVRNP
jgi:YHS domain-containing protein